MSTSENNAGFREFFIVMQHIYHPDYPGVTPFVTGQDKPPTNVSNIIGVHANKQAALEHRHKYAVGRCQRREARGIPSGIQDHTSWTANVVGPVYEVKEMEGSQGEVDAGDDGTIERADESESEMRDGGVDEDEGGDGDGYKRTILETRELVWVVKHQLSSKVEDA